MGQGTIAAVANTDPNYLEINGIYNTNGFLSGIGVGIPYKYSLDFFDNEISGTVYQFNAGIGQKKDNVGVFFRGSIYFSEIDGPKSYGYGLMLMYDFIDHFSLIIGIDDRKEYLFGVGFTF